MGRNNKSEKPYYHGYRECLHQYFVKGGAKANVLGSVTGSPAQTALRFPLAHLDLWSAVLGLAEVELSTRRS